MNTEKIINPPSGYAAFTLFLILLALTAAAFVFEQIAIAVIMGVVNFILVLPGLVIVNPNESKVLTLFGRYIGTVKHDGFFWVNPFTVKKKVSLRAFNLNGQQLKVNDKVGNPIEIAAVIVWQIKDTANAVFAVENYIQYVSIQSEAAVRHLANSFPYDNIEDETASKIRRSHV